MGAHNGLAGSGVQFVGAVDDGNEFRFGEFDGVHSKVVSGK